MANTNLDIHKTNSIDPFSLSMGLFVIVAFPKSTSKSFPMAISIAQTAAIFKVAEIGGKLMHIAGFDKTETDAAKATALLDLVKDWKGCMIFSGGQLLRNTSAIFELLECFMHAHQCRDTASHCHVVIDDPDYEHGYGYGILRVTPHGIQEDPPEQKRYLFPCSLLFSRRVLDANHPSSYQDQAQAAAVKKGIHLCPFFDADKLQEIPRQA